MRSIPVVLLSGILLISCSSDDGGNPAAPPLNPEQEKMQTQVVTLQDARSSALVILLAQMDTIRALDSVAALFRADSSVSWAVAYHEGVAVQYKNGIRGGIDLETDPDGGDGLLRPGNGHRS